MSYKIKNNEQEEYLAVTYSEVNQIFPIFSALYPGKHTGALSELNDRHFDLKILDDHKGAYFEGFGNLSDSEAYNLIDTLNANTSYEVGIVNHNLDFKKAGADEINELIKTHYLNKKK